MQFASIAPGIDVRFHPTQLSGKLVVSATALVSGSGIVRRIEDSRTVRDFMPCQCIASFLWVNR
jgi:hypothetical protein